MSGFATSSKIVMASSASISMTNNVKSPRTMPPKKAEVFKSMEDWGRSHILPFAKPIESCWQPHDLLPDPSSEGFQEEVWGLRERSKNLPDDYLVVLAGDLVTEEALPTYQTMWNRSEAIADETGLSESPWAIWSRAWTAEENRHGDLLNKYLYLSGRVDMRQVEKTIQYLIADGGDNGAGKNPYLTLIYTSFQERATFISHANTAKLARAHGDLHLARICTTIASDEKRHETAYTKIVSKLFELDPDETIACFADMMRRHITMPAYLMRDGHDTHLFQHFASVASRIGVYTIMDYVSVLEHLVRTWGVEKLRGLSSEGRAAQDYVCELGPRMRKSFERTHGRAVKQKLVPFSWIYGREV